MGLFTAIRKLRYPVATDAFNPPLHFKNLAEDVDAKLGPAVANAAALPLVDNWPGRTLLAQDTGIVWVFNTIWQPSTEVPVPTLRDATITTDRVVTQRGAGKIAGNSTVQNNEVVVFPVPFTALPFVQVTASGYRAVGAYNPVGLSASTNFATQAVKSNTQFLLVMNQSGGTLAPSLDYYYDWEATGPIA